MDDAVRGTVALFDVELEGLAVAHRDNPGDGVADDEYRVIDCP